MNLDVRDDSESVAMGYYIARGEERRGEEESRAVSDNGERSNEEVRVFTDDENGGGTRNYEINYSCVLGRGFFSQVVIGTATSPNVAHKKQRYAIKLVDASKLSSKDLSNLQNEVTILYELHHEGIVRLYDFFHDHTGPIPTYDLVMDLMEGGELFDRIAERDKCDELSVRKLCRLMLQAVEHIHLQGIVHRDLKPDNVYFQSRENDNIKIGGFGLAVRVSGHPCCLSTLCGTLSYMAPEMLLRKKYDERVDIWSLGIIFSILLSGQFPFNAQDEGTMMKSIVRGQSRFCSESCDTASDDAVELVKSMMVLNMENRISATGALHNSTW
eukprot:CAMPEP_0113316584 /NCGR_PEP_ID=MMETSP0010_2-20120614/11808_1 /TAXON_ID=216773 ORGANISM="Corethron hystrix, Strain 308" /NCGR_SAMPLE_ID=MMETSP0010_2 /ASSEMBLY_ACC=CAM_ASM_000155 /LENGTH=327 /DNA_ID=CAMNT_0000173343 /DNA_START=169 /DNA_END=1149 /DNA_ORIENTATION=+ /assembly_acc=CAM_ASM_000155